MVRAHARVGLVAVLDRRRGLLSATSSSSARGVGRPASASSKTSSIQRTGRMSRLCLMFLGISTRSRSFSCGISTCSIPPRCAASSFSFRPPIGNTSPRSVISPVMATRISPGCRSAPRPAPCTCHARAGPVLRRRALRHMDVHVVSSDGSRVDAEQLGARRARPSSPPGWTPASHRRAGRCGKLALAGTNAASMRSSSPPTSVQARPVTCPT